MLWELVERVTGVDRRHLKDLIKEKATTYVNSHTCKCGCIEWAHNTTTGACFGCKRCNQFQPKES